MLISHPCKFQQKKRSMVIAAGYQFVFILCMIGEE